MPDPRSPEEIFTRLCERVRSGAGETTPEVRRAAAGLGTDGVPAAFAKLVDTIRKAAYRITDDDIVALRAAGLSDDEIFELTIATTVGVAQRRRASAMTAIRGAVGGEP